MDETLRQLIRETRAPIPHGPKAVCPLRLRVPALWFMQRLHVHQTPVWQSSRDRIQAKVDWQFITLDAQLKLKRLYPTHESGRYTSDFLPDA